MIEAINLDGVGRDRVFIDAYAGHICMPHLWLPSLALIEADQYLKP